MSCMTTLSLLKLCPAQDPADDPISGAQTLGPLMALLGVLPQGESETRPHPYTARWQRWANCLVGAYVCEVGSRRWPRRAGGAGEGSQEEMGLELGGESFHCQGVDLGAQEEETSVLTLPEAHECCDLQASG